MNTEIEFIPVKMRLPLKFGAETVDSIVCARVTVHAYGSSGTGETPLSAAWAWPGSLSFAFREKTMCDFCRVLASAWSEPEDHPMISGYMFLTERLPKILEDFNRKNAVNMPHLAALICASAIDIAVHDAYGNSFDVPVYQTYNSKYMKRDLEWFYGDAGFRGKYPADFFVPELPSELPVWHLVGGKDLLVDAEKSGNEPDDGYPVTLEEWIERDGLKCLKIKLTGTDCEWDYRRLLNVGMIALEHGCHSISPDFNCMVKDVDYVNGILDRVKRDCKPVSDMILYVEQPFPYDLENNRIDVHSVSARKPLFMDESAHDWRFVKLGRELGWTGVALKTCKTQTGALLSACWAKEHGMKLMVQDLTNPMLAIMPHVLLAAHIGTIMGVECNAAQFYPNASKEYERLHPGLYERRNGVVRISSITNQSGLACSAHGPLRILLNSNSR